MTIQQFTDQVKKDGKKLIGDAFLELFKKHPELTGARWNQYTPYWNDGEPCKFRVHSIQVRFSETVETTPTCCSVDFSATAKFCSQCGSPRPQPIKSIDEGDFEEYYGKNKNLSDAISTLERVLEQSAPLLLLVFGDHTETTVTPQDAQNVSIKTEKYDHE